MDGNFNGNLKQIIMAMIGANTDCCEATHTVGDISVTHDITITKIVKAGETVYEAVKDEVEICEHCPYPLPRCKTNGCAYFKEKKAALLEEKRRARELRKKTMKA